MKKRFAIKLTAILLFFASATSFSQIHISGPQSGILIDTTYFVEASGISVEAGDSLFIEPGATFLFNGSAFPVYGYLRAEGTESDSILFIPSAGAIFWAGIDFHNHTADSSLLRYCLIEGSGVDGIAIYSCSPIIDHCTIRRNSSGGSWEAGIFITNSSSPVFSNCIITENKGDMGGGISVSFCTADALPVFRNCIIANNHADYEGGGINVESSSSHAVIDHCLFAFNSASHRGGGIDICSGNAIVRNCTIIGNKSDQGGGGGICVNTAGVSTEITNTIIAYNIGGGISFRSSNFQAIMEYSCLYNNQGGDFSGLSHDSLGILVMVNANSDSCDVNYNILKNPLFVDPHNKNFRLRPPSACIDAGDPSSPLDPDSTIADIGAFYYDQSTGISPSSHIESPTTISLIQNYPNPFNPTTVLRYSLPQTTYTKLTIWNILGQKLITLYEGMQPAGQHTVTWNALGYPSGIYFAQLQTSSSTKVIKMILLK